MTEPADSPQNTPSAAPHLTSKAQADLDARRVREAAALRANLHRRKAQLRQRAVQEGTGAPDTGDTDGLNTGVVGTNIADTGAVDAGVLETPSATQAADADGAGKVRPAVARMTLRLATSNDIEALRALMTAAIDRLQGDFLTPRQVRASHDVMGLDTQLIADGTYYVMEMPGGGLGGCGGWSRRATLFGGDHSAGRVASLLDPAVDAAPFRAMYTHPDHVRQGIARRILQASEQAAWSAGFARGTMAATMAGLCVLQAGGLV